MAAYNHRSRARAGVALILALGVLAVIAGMIMLSMTSAAQTFTDTNRSLQQQSALAAVDAVLARRETRLAQLALTGDATTFRDWKNLGLDSEAAGKNYGEDIIGDFRVRWRIEPLVVTRPDQSGFITNPVPPDESYTLAANQTENDTIFLYRLAAEAVLYTRPDDPKLNDPGNPLYNTPGYPDNPVVARAQGVRFVGADNVPLFRYVIFYAQRGPKGDLELTHGGTVNIKGNVHSNGSIYLGGDTKAMAWDAVSSSSTTNLGPTVGPDGIDNSTGATIGGDDRPIQVVGVDGIFKLSKAVMYGAFNWAAFMQPITASNQTWTAGPYYSLGSTQPAEAKPFPLDDSGNYVDVKTTPALLATVAQATANGSRINPHRIKDESGLVTTDANRQINKATITGASSATPGDSNDARDAFRRTNGGKTWQVASDTDFKRLAKTKESGGREVKLDATLIGRPLEPQKLAYVDHPHTALNESELEDWALPVFRDDGVTPPTATPLSGGVPIVSQATVREAAGYYLALAMGAGDGDASAYSERFNASNLDSRGAAMPMCGWRLDAGASPGGKVGLIIRERYRPRFDLWDDLTPPANGGPAVLVPANDPQYKPYAYGKHYYPTIPNPFVPVLVGVPRTTTSSVIAAATDIHPSRNTVVFDGSKLTVTAGCGVGDVSSLSTRYTRSLFTESPRRLVNVGTTSYAAKDISYLAVKIASPDLSGSTDKKRTAGLAIMRGDLNHANPQASCLTAAITSGATTLAVDNTADLKPGALLILGGVEVVQVLAIGPTATPVVLTANQIYVRRGLSDTTAIAHAANATIQSTAVLPVACRLVNDITPAQTSITVNSVTGIAKGQKLSLGTEVVRVDEVTGPNTLKVIRNQDSGGPYAARTHNAGAPLHWQTGAPFLAIGYARNRTDDKPSVFIQRRERPIEVSVGTTQYWNGNGTAGSDTFVFTRVADTDALPAAVSVVQTRTGTGNSVSTSSSTAYPDKTSSIVWTDESTTFTVTDYGRKRQDRTEYRYSYETWQLDLAVGSNVPAGMGFWDPTATAQDGYGDLGRSLRLFDGTTALTPDITITSLATALGLDYYKVARRSDTVYGYPTVPSFPTGTIGDNETVYEDTVGGSATSKYVFARKTDGSFDAGAKTMTVWSISPALPTNPYVIPSGAWAGWKLSTTSATAPNPTDPAVAPPLPNSSPYAAITGSTNGSPSPAIERRFNIDRSVQTIDRNSYTTRSGNWWPTPQGYFVPQAGSYTTTRSFRPDSWHGTAPFAAPPVPGASPTSVTSNGQKFTDDIILGATPPAEIWLAMRVVKKSAPGSLAQPTDALSDRAVRFYYYSGATPPATGDASGAEWLPINDPTGTAPILANLDELVCNAGDTAPMLVGVYTQSANNTTPMSVDFTNYTFGKMDGSTVTFQNATGASSKPLTNYLRSQYQVWWGTREITDDFFSWNENDNSKRLATEDWFFQPREFWSQSRWWNEDVQAPTTSSAAPVGTGGTAGMWLIEKDNSGNPGSGSADNSVNRSSTTNRRLFAKTTVLTLNMRELQDYIRTRVLADATDDTADAGGGLLKSSFNGLIYAARTNRAPWIPDLNLNVAAAPGYPLVHRDRGILFNAANRCWLSHLWNYGADPTSTSGSRDNYDTFSATCPPFDPFTRGGNYYLGSAGTDPGALNDIGALTAGSAIPDDVAAKLVPGVSPYKDMLTPRIRMQDFHHGIRLKNAASIDWNYPTVGAKTFGECKLSVVTPNQLYLWGNFNSTAHAVKLRDGTTKNRPTPVAVMGDVITLLSNSFNDSTYQQDLLSVDTRRVTGGGILAQWNGAVASSTTYNTCILTHNLPTTKASSRFGEASSFVNTMQYLENWNGKVMSYTGSLVVMNSRRYSQAYLLEQPKLSGRTPFGWAGWNARSTTNGTVEKPDGSFHPGTGYLDWISNGGKTANTANELLPATWPLALKGACTIANTNDGIPPVYYQPTRNLSFNEDLLTAEGTPPFTPFGQTVKGLGAWSRVVQ